MRIKPETVIEPLGAQDFALAWVDLAERTIHFVRPSCHEGLYEAVHMWEGGPGGEVLTGFAVVGVVRHRPHWKGLSYSQAIVDFANVPERGWTKVGSVAERKDWLTKISSVAPERCRSLASSFGSEVLNRTAAARRVAKGYFEYVTANETLSELSTRLEGRCSQEMIERIKELLPRFAWIWWLDVFFLASLIMAQFGRIVEPDKPTLLDLPSPDDDREVMWRLFVLVDLMITEFSINRKELTPPPWLFQEGVLRLQTYEVGTEREAHGD